MNYNRDQYFEKITSIQQSLHERERRRLELERELFVYCRSDKRISQIKCSKLRSYLREISEREERAKRRNLELLRDVDSIENSMKMFQANQEPLLQQKAKVLKMISKSVDVRKIKNQKSESAKVEIKRHQDISFTEPDKTTEISAMWLKTKDGLTSASSDHNHQHLAEEHLKDSRAGLEETVSNQAYLSDDISSSNDPPDGCNLRKEHERTRAEFPNVCAVTLNARNVPSPPVTLTATEEKQSPCSSGLKGAGNPIVEKTKPKESTAQPPGKEEESGLIPENTPGKKCLVLPEGCEDSLSSEISLTESRSSALSISLTQSELDEDLAESEAAAKHDLNEDSDTQFSPKSSAHSEQSEGPMEGFPTESLSFVGLLKLFDTIEGQPHAEQCKVYSNPSIGKTNLSRLIRLCNGGEDLNGEDSTACGAVVLRELQRLSWSTVKGCLLPPDLVDAHQSFTTPQEISARLPPDAAQLWDRWFKHALLLKERSVLGSESLVQLFTPLLLERHASYGQQAKVLLRTLLSRSSEECPSAEDESDASSFGPTPLPSSAVVKPLQKQHSPELQSSEEDSQDESPVESVPIKESKAYLLLKQSAMQRRILKSAEEEDEEEEMTDDLDEDHGWAERPLHQDPYPRTEEVNSKTSSALQSKAFWGESDDSDAEIEAALRPQPFSANNVDTADFYS